MRDRRPLSDGGVRRCCLLERRGRRTEGAWGEARVDRLDGREEKGEMLEIEICWLLRLRAREGRCKRCGVPKQRR